MSERPVWESKRKQIIARANELRPEYRADFLQTMTEFGMFDTMIHTETGIEVAKGEEWRVEKLLAGDFSHGRGTVYKKKKKK
jgi:hypothetical protein